MKQLTAILLLLVLCLPLCAQAEDAPTCWTEQVNQINGTPIEELAAYPDVCALLGEPFYEYPGPLGKVAAWETDQGRFLAEFTRERRVSPYSDEVREYLLTRWLHITPDRTRLAGNIPAEDTLYILRDKVDQSCYRASENYLLLTDVGYNDYCPAAITADGYTIVRYHADWIVHDCVKDRQPGLLTYLRIWLGW